MEKKFGLKMKIYSKMCSFYAHLKKWKLVGRYYFQKSGNDLIDVIEMKFSVKNKTLLREVVFANIILLELYSEKNLQFN